MSSVPQVLKLAELRAKTDRQLHWLVYKTLERGRVVAKMAGAQFALGNRPGAERLRTQAERAYREAGMFMQVMNGLSPLQRTLLERRRRALRERLDRLYEHRAPLTRTACG